MFGKDAYTELTVEWTYFIIAVTLTQKRIIVATIKDIARETGISIGTVDRILHNRGRFSADTAKKVRKTVNALGYKPNIHAKALRKARTFYFSAVIPEAHQDSGYWQLVLQGVILASTELESYNSKVEILHFDRYSPISFKHTLNEAINKGPDGILIAPVLPIESCEILNTCTIPYLFIDSDIPELSNRISYIGQDSNQSGILAAKLMTILLGQRIDMADPSVLIIDPSGSDENYHINSRIEGFHEGARRLIPHAQLQVKQVNPDDEKSFHSFLNQYFQSSPDLPKGIFVANSTVYHAASYLEKAGEPYSSIYLIGYDLIPERTGYIDREIINFIITQQPEEQSYLGLMMLYDKLVLNKTIQEKRITPLNIITKENLNTFKRYTKRS